MSINKEKCIECGKIVYVAERIGIDNGIYHKQCFRYF